MIILLIVLLTAASARVLLLLVGSTPKNISSRLSKLAAYGIIRKTKIAVGDRFRPAFTDLSEKSVQ